MAVKLVTGYSGTEHVTSSDDGARQAGTVGTGMYALETVEDPLAATLENANTVTVGPGDVLINGRHARLTGSTTFAVPVGTQAMQTSNLLVLRYSVSDDGTEKVEAVTLTGEPAASDPQDPELATGSILDGDSPVDMALYRVVTTGIESAQPVRLFSTVPPIADLTLGNLPGSLTSDQLPVVPVSKGGTGATDAAGAREGLGLGGVATRDVYMGGGANSANMAAGFTSAGVLEIGPTLDFHQQGSSADFDFRIILDGSNGPTFSKPLPLGSGGTGATSAAGARGNLGLDGRVGYFKANRSSGVSSLSRDTLYNLAPGTYLVVDNATSGPESGDYGNLLVGYCAGNRIVGLLAYDNGHVYTTYGASSSATFGWKRIDAIGSGYDTLWTGSVGSGGTISLSLATLQQYRVVGVMTSYSSTFAIPALVYNNGSGVRVYGVGGYCSDGGDLLLQYFALRQSGSSLVAYARSQDLYSSSTGSRQSVNITAILGVC